MQAAVVDDNQVNLKVAGAMLSKYGIKANLYSSGREFLDSYESGEQYDIVFMDHMMPELDGVETVQNLRKMTTGNSKTVPVIALTANAIRGVEAEYKKAGMNDCLFKPMSLKQLQEKLEIYIPKDKIDIKEE